MECSRRLCATAIWFHQIQMFSNQRIWPANDLAHFQRTIEEMMVYLEAARARLAHMLATPERATRRNGNYIDKI